MAEEEDDGAIIEDEDEDGIDIESDEDDDDVWDGDSEADEINDQFYSSPLDDIHEILNLHDKLNALQTSQSDFFQFLMSQIDEQEMTSLHQTLQAAQQGIQLQQQ